MAGYGSGFSRYATKKEKRKESAFDRYDSKKEESVPDYLSALKQAMRQNPYGLLADEMVRSGYFDRVNKYSREGSDYAGEGADQIRAGGNPLEGLPKIGLGALGWLTSPINAAAAPLAEPLMQPIANAVNDVTGRSLERLSGYPAELTTGLAMALIPGNKRGRMPREIFNKEPQRAWTEEEKLQSRADWLHSKGYEDVDGYIVTPEVAGQARALAPLASGLTDLFGIKGVEQPGILEMRTLEAAKKKGLLSEEEFKKRSFYPRSVFEKK